MGTNATAKGLKKLLNLSTITLVVLFAFGVGWLGAKTSQAQAAEICNNGADDDSDALIDCFDSDCLGAVCHTFDFDGILYDFTCGSNPLGCSHSEICNNNNDDDLDFNMDCFDVVDCPTGTPCKTLENTPGTCSPTGCVETGPVNCDDSNVCTTDTLDASNVCVHTPISCEDGDLCTNDTCDPIFGCGHDPKGCGDGVACTIDSCDSSLGCVYTADNASCETCFEGVDSNNNGLIDCADEASCPHLADGGGATQTCEFCPQKICDGKNVGDPCGGSDPGDGSAGPGPFVFFEGGFLEVSQGNCFKPGADPGTACDGDCLCVPPDTGCPSTCAFQQLPQFLQSIFQNQADRVAYLNSLNVPQCAYDVAVEEGLCHPSNNTNPFCLTPDDQQEVNCQDPQDPNYDFTLCQSCVNWVLPASTYPVPGLGTAGCGGWTPAWSIAQGPMDLQGLLLDFDPDNNPELLDAQVVFAVNANSCVLGIREHDEGEEDEVEVELTFLTQEQSTACKAILDSCNVDDDNDGIANCFEVVCDINVCAGYLCAQCTETAEGVVCTGNECEGCGPTITQLLADNPGATLQDACCNTGDLGTPECTSGDQCCSQNCRTAPADGQSCNNDGNACTNDQCSGGACYTGSAVDCDDQDPCTEDSCDDQSGCVHSPIPGCAAGCDVSACIPHICEQCIQTGADVACTGECENCGPLIAGELAEIPSTLPAICCTDDLGTPDCNSPGDCCSENCRAVNEAGSCDDGNSCTAGDICSNGTCTGTGTGTGSGSVSGMKYYDANANGANDGEGGVSGWMISYTGSSSGTVSTGADGSYSVQLPDGSYTFTEVAASGSTWFQTGDPESYSVEINGCNAVTNIDFGNVCIGKAVGGSDGTVGFWGNKNGQALVGNDDLAMLQGLNLKDAKGNNFDPTSYTQLNKWFKGANASANMAYKLSSQLAAMALNVYNGKVDGSALIKVGSLTPSGFASVDYIMDLADDDLLVHPLTTGGPEKAYQSTLSDILDAANKNTNFVQPNSSTCPAPTFSMNTPLQGEIGERYALNDVRYR